jgi:hypothetical protein
MQPNTNYYIDDYVDIIDNQGNTNYRLIHIDARTISVGSSPDNYYLFLPEQVFAFTKIIIDFRKYAYVAEPMGHKLTINGNGRLIMLPGYNYVGGSDNHVNTVSVHNGAVISFVEMGGASQGWGIDSWVPQYPTEWHYLSGGGTTMTVVDTEYELARIDMKSVITDPLLINFSAESVNTSGTSNAHLYKVQRSTNGSSWNDISYSFMQHNVPNNQSQIVAINTIKSGTSTSVRYVRVICKKSVNVGGNSVQNIALVVTPARNIS